MPMPGDRPRAALALAAVTLLCGSAAVALAAPTFPPKHTCGHFFSKGDDVIVLNGGPVSCTSATSIIHAFWSGSGVTMHGASDASGYFTIRAWPGWRCYQAAGSGDCIKHKSIAAYEVKGKF